MSDVPETQATRLREALAALPTDERRVFLLHAAESMDYPAIARRLSITVFEVERLLAAALVLLDRHLSARGADSAPPGNGA
ncbi:DNA-directed RNA polymerase specialized sigma24 family protein [Sphingomonas leidyi]|uniref:DNA-directed RNA polymerase specialized sigma24 family protein n=1 Tax=Sphingomonas leidyi TaxID=68569 RepID=A0A7X5UVR6_9SPHN|nr:sigma-70 region 4 domain-containing protein [Sphingomonas leidyi]NIJ63157.1 DNA-directed RNA polymerase specialized sigma24 family protein [Sphingomonas leidyi]